MTVPVKRLLIFPNDPIHRYVEKGEVKPRYFNPGNTFDEVHVMEFSDTPTPVVSVQPFAGRARISIYALGTIRTLVRSGRLLTLERSTARLVGSIGPSVIRGYNSTLGGFLAVRTARHLGIPSVVSLHIDRDEVRQFERLPLMHRLYERLSRAWFEPYAMQRADVVLPVSEFLGQYARRYGASDIRVIYNRVSTAQFRPPAVLPPRSGRFRILSVGRLDPQKQQGVLIRAIRDLDAELVLIGDGSMRGELEALIHAVGVHDRVHIIPSVPHQDIQRWYWDADVFAIASRYEGFCMPILEAMAAGLPVVVNDKDPLPEIVGDAGIIVPATPEAFRNAFARLQTDASFRRAFRTRALDRAEDLDGAQFEAREADVYRSFIGGTPKNI
ncbi:MAG: glycosyltransferase family 4 protein [bacterium]|nr:glycosyltransferase family 4 protein [bacterium]